MLIKKHNIQHVVAVIKEKLLLTTNLTIYKANFIKANTLNKIFQKFPILNGWEAVFLPNGDLEKIQYTNTSLTEENLKLLQLLQQDCSRFLEKNGIIEASWVVDQRSYLLKNAFNFQQKRKIEWKFDRGKFEERILQEKNIFTIKEHPERINIPEYLLLIGTPVLINENTWQITSAQNKIIEIEGITLTGDYPVLNVKLPSNTISYESQAWTISSPQGILFLFYFQYAVYNEINDAVNTDNLNLTDNSAVTQFLLKTQTTQTYQGICFLESTKTKETDWSFISPLTNYGARRIKEFEDYEYLPALYRDWLEK